MAAPYTFSANIFQLVDPGAASQGDKDLVGRANRLLNSEGSEDRRKQIQDIAKEGLEKDGYTDTALALLANFNLPQTVPKPSDNSKLIIEVVEPEGTEEIQIKYSWAEGYQPTLEEMKFQEELEKAEVDIKRFSKPQNEASYLYPLVDWLYPAKVTGGSKDRRRLLNRLVNIGRMCLGSGDFDLDRATSLIRNVLADATLSYGMERRAEIAFRFGSALVVTLILLAVGRSLFVMVEQLGLIDPVAMVTPQRSLLVIIFFCAVSLTAWASYMQRSMSIVERTPEADLNDLRLLLADTVHPAIRTFYIFTFTLIALVLLHLQIVTISLGQFSTTDVLSDLKVTVLSGLLLGLAERTLPAAMSTRATNFAGSLGAAQSSETKQGAV